MSFSFLDDEQYVYTVPCSLFVFLFRSILFMSSGGGVGKFLSSIILRSIAMKPNVKGFIHKDSNTICYLVSDPSSGKAAIIDSVLDFQADTCSTKTDFIDNVLKEAVNFEITHCLETHCHADHLSGK